MQRVSKSAASGRRNQYLLGDALHSNCNGATASDQAAVIGLENMIDGTAEQVMAYVLEMKRNPIFYAGERDKCRKRVLSFERCQNQAWKNMIDTLERRIKGKSSPKISIE